MDELQPQELEELVQELEEEDDADESLPPEVEELLRVLQSGSLYLTRRNAAEQLGKVGTSSPRIVQALIAAQDSDSNSEVRRAAAKSLRAPVHQEYLQQPDSVESSFLASVFHDSRWRWAPVYAVFLLVATALPFAVTSIWTVLVAGVVWFAGGVLGLVILGRKGYGTGGGVFSVLDMFDDNSSCSLYLWLVLLVLFALAGPVILLMALFIRPRGSVVGVSKQRAEAKAAGRRKPSPVHEGDLSLDCTACGAWNAPGSEKCGECGTALDGADLGFKGTSECRATDRYAGRHVSAKDGVYRRSDKPQALSYQVGAALGALFVRTRRSRTKRIDPVSSGEPEGLDPQASRKGSPVHEGDRPSDCTACGARNPPGSEHCVECGAALEGTEV